MPAGRSRPAAAVALRQAAARAPPRRPVDHRGGGDAVEPAGAPARYRGKAQRELRADARSRPRTRGGAGRAAALSGGAFLYVAVLSFGVMLRESGTSSNPCAISGTHAVP